MPQAFPSHVYRPFRAPAGRKRTVLERDLDKRRGPPYRIRNGHRPGPTGLQPGDRNLPPEIHQPGRLTGHRLADAAQRFPLAECSRVHRRVSPPYDLTRIRIEVKQRKSGQGTRTSQFPVGGYPPVSTKSPGRDQCPNRRLERPFGHAVPACQVWPERTDPWRQGQGVADRLLIQRTQGALRSPRAQLRFRLLEAQQHLLELSHTGGAVRCKDHEGRPGAHHIDATLEPEEGDVLRSSR